MTVGGGTRVFGAQAWRFHPKDFRMASEYGRPEGSSLADWPLSYEELAPYYEKAEWLVGVAGDDVGFPEAGPRARGYPMPPVPSNPERPLLAKGAASLGWATAPVPLLINTQHYNGRSACVQCGQCVGFACPSESKNGTHNTMIPRALQTGNCHLLCEAQATKILTGASGKVMGVEFKYNGKNGRIHIKTIKAQQVVVSAGAIESARLLLASSSPQHPSGLGNHSDQVGRHLQGHVYPAAIGRFAHSVKDGNGPGVSIATTHFNHGNVGIIGGGMMANEFVKLPIIHYLGALAPDDPRWGAAGKRLMRDSYSRTIHITGPIQEIPNPNARITLAPRVTDRFGMPVACLSGAVHAESIKTADFMRLQAEKWLRASGATKVWSQPYANRTPFLSAGQHQAGTCRMGHDPATSVTDSWGRVHGHDNLFVVDGSLHVTNGGFNPVLTIMALSFRCAERMVG